ncbi:MAG: Mov34/MPN/PAD-1 family protein [Lautropia sp.]
MPIRWTDTSESAPLPCVEGRGEAPELHVAPQADAVVRAHLASAATELGGLLIGVAYAYPPRDASPQRVAHVAIHRAVPANEADATGVSLRMGTSVWQAAQRAMAPGERIVGWYHSHPGLTAFFSETDRRTQRAFFAHPWSIGWVVDPWLGDEAFFIGPDCRPLSRGPALPRSDAPPASGSHTG